MSLTVYLYFVYLCNCVFVHLNTSTDVTTMSLTVNGGSYIFVMLTDTTHPNPPTHTAQSYIDMPFEGTVRNKGAEF